MKVYIGSAIDTALGSPQEQFQDLVEVVRLACKKSQTKYVVFNPLTAYVDAAGELEIKDMHYVADINTFAVEQADIGVFSWTNSPSFGVPLEIEAFARARKPFFVWNRSERSMGMYLRRHLGEGGTGKGAGTRNGIVEALTDFLSTHTEEDSN